MTAAVIANAWRMGREGGVISFIDENGETDFYFVDTPTAAYLHHGGRLELKRPQIPEHELTGSLPGSMAFTAEWSVKRLQQLARVAAARAQFDALSPKEQRRKLVEAEKHDRVYVLFGQESEQEWAERKDLEASGLPYHEWAARRALNDP